jgi:hypothetical protein
MLKYGLTPKEWDDSKAEARDILIARASDHLGMIPYGELASKIKVATFQPHEYALWALIGEISEEEDDAGRGLLSVIVVHKNGDMEPGHGFYELASSRGRDMSDRVKGWIAEVHRVHAYWRDHPKSAATS